MWMYYNTLSGRRTVTDFEFLCLSSPYLTLEKQGFMLKTPLKGLSVVVAERLESITHSLSSLTFSHLDQELEPGTFQKDCLAVLARS